MASVHTVIATGGEGDLAPLQGCGKTVLRYEEVLAGQEESFDWPELDELSAAAMCYTSGTTGDPKGVVYSHRSTYLHSLTACTANALSVSEADRVLAIVPPCFTPMRGGLIYAALMSGADLVLPDRYLQAEPLVSIIEDTRPTLAGAVPTIWNDVDRYLDSHPERDISSLRLVACGGICCSGFLDAGIRREVRRAHCAGLGGYDRNLSVGDRCTSGSQSRRDATMGNARIPGSADLRCRNPVAG